MADAVSTRAAEQLIGLPDATSDEELQAAESDFAQQQQQQQQQGGGDGLAAGGSRSVRSCIDGRRVAADRCPASRGIGQPHLKTLLVELSASDEEGTLDASGLFMCKLVSRMGCGDGYGALTENALVTNLDILRSLLRARAAVSSSFRLPVSRYWHEAWGSGRNTRASSSPGPPYHSMPQL